MIKHYLNITKTDRPSPPTLSGKRQRCHPQRPGPLHAGPNIVKEPYLLPLPSPTCGRGVGGEGVSGLNITSKTSGSLEGTCEAATNDLSFNDGSYYHD
jgi:hypothetical protein